MATVARENIGLLNDKITVKVSKEDYFPTFEKKLKEYSKTVNMPGFRKGMVPTGMIRKMYGPSIYTDEILKTVEKELHTYLDTERPDIFAQPLALDADIRALDLNNPAEYEFGFEIGLKPVFEIAPLEKANVTFNKVKVTDEMVQEEVERMQIKGGEMTDLETINDEAEVLTILFVEFDSTGQANEDGIQKEISIDLKDLTPAAKEEFKGKETAAILPAIQLSKLFEDDKLERVLHDLGVDINDQNGKDKYFQLTIVKISRIEKRKLDETFFKEIFPGSAVSTEEELRQKLREEIQQYWDGQSRVQLHDQLFHYLVDETHLEFPAEFLKRWLQNGSQERKTPEQAEAEFPTFINQLKWTLISDRLVKDYNLEVTREELKEAMKAEVMQYFGNMQMGNDMGWLDSYLEKMMKDEKQAEATFHRLITNKIFDYAQSKANPIEKEVTPVELAAMQHHHH